MGCCSIKVWKCFIAIGGIIFAIFGATLLGLSVVISKKDFAEAADIKNIIFGFGTAFGVVIMVVGLTGWLTSCKENRCLVILVPSFLILSIS